MHYPHNFLMEELTELKAKGLYRDLKILQGAQLAYAQFDGQGVINLSSNNYLGLTTHPAMRQAAQSAIDTYGVGSGSVRTIAGTMTLHEELEVKLANFKHTEAALVLQSGFAANLAVIPSLVGEGDVVISDELNHASIIDGCRLSRAQRKVYPHCDLAGLAQVLAESVSARRILIITDGVFSMDGDIAPLAEIVELAESYGAMVMVDDAHASGVLGENGRGSVDHFKLHGRVHVQIGTLSKALGVLGGYVAGNRELRELLIHKGRPFLFSTSHPPAVAAACSTAIDILLAEEDLLTKLWDNANYFKHGLQQLGFDTGCSQTPITPVIVGNGPKAMALSEQLFANGVFAQAIAFPMVPEAKSRVRTIVTATHSKQQLERALNVFDKVGRELALI
ncbi:MAG: glycine C-acetyltransferase [Peptococcaceae bacterium]|nr:glycine C-acetyltransferase [Peptococcaceae bacterium]